MLFNFLTLNYILIVRRSLPSAVTVPVFDLIPSYLFDLIPNVFYLVLCCWYSTLYANVCSCWADANLHQHSTSVLFSFFLSCS